MLAIELTLSIYPLIGLTLGAFAAGFLLRGSQIRASKKKVIELENEMLNNHAEILELQRERAELLRQMKESKIPVISIRSSKDDNGDKRQAK